MSVRVGSLRDPSSAPERDGGTTAGGCGRGDEVPGSPGSQPPQGWAVAISIAQVQVAEAVLLVSVAARESSPPAPSHL